MALLARSSFVQGWVPDADPVNGPADGLLRMDNCTLDELGVVALRRGSLKINGSAFSDTDVHSLFTAVLSSTRYRMAGAGNAVYANGASIATGFAGSGDIAFGSHLGQILFARSTTKKKYDGTTVRNWGISMSGGAPTVAATAADSKEFASCNSGETTWAANEDDGTGVTFTTGQDGTANGAIVIHPNTGTGRGTLTKTFGSDQDFTSYSGGGVGTDDDVIELYVYVTEPKDLQGLQLMVDVNSGSANAFQDDYYVHEFLQDESASLTLPTDDFLAGDFTAEGRARERVGAVRQERNQLVARLRSDLPVANAGWAKLQVRRGQMQRVGATSGKGWATVRAVRLVARTFAATQLRYDTIRIVSAAPETSAKFRYIYVRNTGTYNAKSAPSTASSEILVNAAGATVTAPSDGSRDSQVNEIWVFKMGGVLDAWYRVKVQTSVSGTGSVAITVTMSDRDALIANIRLETDNTTPPDSIIDVEGPYFDRTFALTATTLYPSRRLNPESFATGQSITVSGVDEVAYWVKKAIGGLYIGTSKDVYVLEGDGAELPDETINFTLRPLNVDHPPIGDAVAQEGNLLVYLADDGWRAMSGAGSQSLVGETSLLYKGQVRHGRGPVNLTTGRFRAAIAKGQLVCLTPENTETTSTARLYRHVFATKRWYYHVYPQAFRCVYREPDGTLIASDAAGFVRTLDTGSDDDGASIGVVLWTKVDDDGRPFQRKDLWDVRARLNTGAATATAAVHLNSSAAAATSVTFSTTEMNEDTRAVNTVAAAREAQLRITGSFTTFLWSAFGVSYHEHPVLQTYAEPKPDAPSAARRRFSGLQLAVDTLGAAASVTPVLDGTALAVISLTTSNAVARALTRQSVVGRDLWPRISQASGFELYSWAPMVLETLPPPLQGRVPATTADYPGVKVLSGLQLRLCTLGATRTITPILDGVSGDAVTVASGVDDPTDLTIRFDEPEEATEIAWSVDGDVELYSWSPLVTAKRPLGVRAWDSGPLDLGVGELVWVRRVRMKVRAGANLAVTPYFDGAPFPAVTLTGIPADVDTVLDVFVDSRRYKGRVPRFVVTSAEPFYPYWIEFLRRETGQQTAKKPIRVSVGLGG